MQEKLGWAAGVAMVIAVVAVFADRRRNRRADPDKVGFMPWALIQVVAFLISVVLAGLAVTSR